MCNRRNRLLKNVFGFLFAFFFFCQNIFGSSDIIAPYIAALKQQDYASAANLISQELAELLIETEFLCTHAQPASILGSLHGVRKISHREVNALLIITARDQSAQERTVAFQVQLTRMGQNWLFSKIVPNPEIKNSTIEIEAFPSQKSIQAVQENIVNFPINHPNAIALLLANGLKIDQIQLGTLPAVKYKCAGTFNDQHLWLVQWDTPINLHAARLTIQYKGRIYQEQKNQPITSAGCYLLDEFVWQPFLSNNLAHYEKIIERTNYPRKMVLTLPKGWRAVSNGVLIQKSVDSEKKKIRYTYDLHDAVGTRFNQISWAASPDWRYNQTTIKNSKKLQTFTLNTLQYWEKLKEWQAITGKIIQVFEQNYAPYPFEGCAVAEVEGLCYPSYNCGSLTLVEKTDQTVNRQFIATLSHQIGRSWINALIYPKGEGYKWLEEGFAAFSQLMFLENYNEKLLHDQLEYFALNYFSRVDAADDLAIMEACSRHLSPVAFDAINQSKGGYIFYMLRSLVGHDNFKKIMHQYLHEFENKFVSVDDFFKICETVYGHKLDWFINQWLNHVGAPELKFSYRVKPEKGKYKVIGKISQHAKYIFKIPVNVLIRAKSGNHIKQVWLDSRENMFSFTLREKPVELLFDAKIEILRHTETLDRLAFIEQSLRKGRTFYNAKKYEEALKLYKLAMAQDSTHSELRYNRGKCLLALKEYRPARFEFLQAAKYAGSNTWLEGWSYYRVGEIYMHLSMRDHAINKFQEALKCKNVFELHQQVRLKLRKIYMAANDED